MPEDRNINGGTNTIRSLSDKVDSIKAVLDSIVGDGDGTTTPLIALPYGEQDSGTLVPINVDANGHVEVAIHGPLNPFGSVHMEEQQPQFQVDCVYGINPDQMIETTGNAITPGGANTATNSGANNLFKCSTGTTAGSFASLQTRRRLRYRAGQGIIGRFTMMFSTPQANSILVAGVGTSESGYYFGYNGTSFGILHSTGGIREIQTLTISTASTTAENITITLAGVAHSVPVTNSGSTTKTAYEIATFSTGYTGFKAEQRGSTVIFLADSAGNKSGTFSLSAATTAVGSFAETVAGVASTDTWIPQTSWNGDTMDGNGPSGMTLNPAYLNVAQISIQYLGAGSVSFQIEATFGGNNPIFVDVHRINFPNSQTTVSINQPAFPFTMAAYSIGSTTDVWVACASCAGMLEGHKYLLGPLLTYARDTSGFVGSTANTYYPLVSVRNDLIHRHGSVTPRANQSVVNVISMAACHDDATPVTFYLLRNATLLGPTDFQSFSSVSCTYYDVASTTCTVALNEQILKSIPIAQNGSSIIQFEDQDIVVNPGEVITLAARAVTGTATYVNASLNTREDQ